MNAIAEDGHLVSEVVAISRVVAWGVRFNLMSAAWSSQLFIRYGRARAVYRRVPNLPAKNTTKEGKSDELGCHTPVTFPVAKVMSECMTEIAQSGAIDGVAQKR